MNNVIPTVEMSQNNIPDFEALYPFQCYAIAITNDKGSHTVALHP
ncbi:MAG: hypothetical protein SNF68_03970 [Rikenellaceae bacterium]